MSSQGKRRLAFVRSLLLPALLVLLVSRIIFPAEAALVSTRVEFLAKTGAGARDGSTYDLPPDQIGSVITNGFGVIETNLASNASVASASGQSGARQRSEVQPLLITAQGELSASTATATNLDESASAQANCRLDLLFDLPLQHAYSLNVTNLGSVSSGSLLGQIVLTRDAVEVFASRLPTNSGASAQSGVLPAGSYRLLAEFNINPADAPPASSASAAYSLLMSFTPIVPTLNITRASPNVILSWTTNDTTTFLLQSNTNLTTTNWTLIYGPYPIVGDQYAVPESAAEAMTFYRLIVP